VTDYQGNTHKSKQVPQTQPEDKVVEKVVTGVVVTKKKSFGQKFRSVFLGGDVKNALRYVTADVLLPAIRNLMVDATTRGVERVVYGESAMRRRPINYGSRVQYNSPVRRDRAYLPDQAPARPLGRQVRRETNDLVLTSREEAELVLERLTDIIDKYGVASLADLYDLTGLPTSHVDNKWGWTYLNNTEIRQVRDGYLLDLPPVEEI
jgi:hypothetical protein